MKTNYLDQLKHCLSPTIRADLDSRSLCPYMLYQLFPYLLTLIEGGWFGWVPRGKKPSTREETFSLLWGQRPNSAFVNEVLVRCPNQNAGVIIGVGPDSKLRLKIRILHVEGHCRMGYQTGTILSWHKKDLDKDEIFIRNFPGLIGEAFREKHDIRPCCSVQGQKESRITTKQIHTPCRYHQQKTSYSGRKGYTGGLCPAVFQAAYPRGLGTYYGIRQKGLHTIVCPVESKNKTTIYIERKKVYPEPFHKLIERLAILMGRFFHPVDPLLYSLAFIIGNVPNPNCIHIEGEVFKFNLRRKDILCPASAYSLCPYLTLSTTARKRFLESGGWSDMVCPDFVGTSYTLET